MKKEIGFKIKLLRIKEGLSQNELAKNLGVSLKTLKNWEAGRCKMRLKGLVKIVIFFKVTCNYMLGLEKNENELKYQRENYTAFRAKCNGVEKSQN